MKGDDNESSGIGANGGYGLPDEIVNGWTTVGYVDSSVYQQFVAENASRYAIIIGTVLKRGVHNV